MRLGRHKLRLGSRPLLSDKEEKEIKEWVESHTVGVPGRCQVVCAGPPDDWRLRALRNLNKFQNAFSGSTLDNIIEELCEADVVEDVDVRWRAAKPKEEGMSAGGGECQPSHEPEPAPPPPKPLYFKEADATPCALECAGGAPISDMCEYSDMIAWPYRRAPQLSTGIWSAQIKHRRRAAGVQAHAVADGRRDGVTEAFRSST